MYMPPMHRPGGTATVTIDAALSRTYDEEWTHGDAVLPRMIDYHQAHQIVASEAGIVPPEIASALCRQLQSLRGVSAADLPYRSELDGLHPCLEARVAAEAGAETSGWLNAGRARQEIEMVARLLLVRDSLLDTITSQISVRAALIDAAEREAKTVMPWQTWGQPAEVATAGYVLEASALAVADDTRRLLRDLADISRSRADIGQVVPPPFAYDRERVGRFLGLSAPVESSLRAYGSGDTECTLLSHLAVAGGNLARLAETLFVWCSAEFALARFGPAFTGTSHIMPQKRNPYALRLIRPLFSRISGRAVDALHLFAGGAPMIGNGVIHIPNRAYESVVDLDLVQRSLAGAIPSLEIDRAHARASLEGSWCVAPQLVFSLVAECHMPFKQAHHVVAHLVHSLEADRRGPETLTPEDVAHAGEVATGRRLDVSETLVKCVFDPLALVKTRNNGGPAPTALASRLGEAREALARDGEVVANWRARVENGRASLQDAMRRLPEAR